MSTFRRSGIGQLVGWLNGLRNMLVIGSWRDGITFPLSNIIIWRRYLLLIWMVRLVDFVDFVGIGMMMYFKSEDSGSGLAL